jgi:hypothetical protein
VLLSHAHTKGGDGRATQAKGPEGRSNTARSVTHRSESTAPEPMASDENVEPDISGVGNPRHGEQGGLSSAEDLKFRDIAESSGARVLWSRKDYRHLSFEAIKAIKANIPKARVIPVEFRRCGSRVNPCVVNYLTPHSPSLIYYSGNLTQTVARALSSVFVCILSKVRARTKGQGSQGKGEQTPCR